jgi:alpha-ketoglutarate-dependent taurine dioxygenase
MRVSKIPGLGRFGVYIDGVDFNHLTHEEWMEIGKLHLDTLVTIVRDCKLSPTAFNGWITQFGDSRVSFEAALAKKYGQPISKLAELAVAGDSLLSPVDSQFLHNCMRLGSPQELGAGVLRVSGRVDADGNPLGMFREGELLWHSNESGSLTFSPAVALLASENVVGSSTGFVSTTDWYEAQSEAFRSELDEMVIVHRFTPGRINPGLNQGQDDIMYRNMCPVDDVEVPLVIRSPGGHMGLHYSVNTIYGVKGMSPEESLRLFTRINEGLFVDKYIYDHWYQQNGDLCLFDNSIVLHRRKGDIKNRLCYRFQYDYSHLQDGPYVPYLQEPYIGRYKTEIREIVELMGLQSFKLPRADSQTTPAHSRGAYWLEPYQLADGKAKAIVGEEPRPSYQPGHASLG